MMKLLPHEMRGTPKWDEMLTRLVRISMSESPFLLLHHDMLAIYVAITLVLSVPGTSSGYVNQIRLYVIKRMPLWNCPQSNSNSPSPLWAELGGKDKRVQGVWYQLARVYSCHSEGDAQTLNSSSCIWMEWKKLSGPRNNCAKYTVWGIWNQILLLICVSHPVSLCFGFFNTSDTTIFMF